MRRWFLSYNSQDLGLMQSLEAALRRKDAGAHIYFAPKSVKAGTFWLPSLANEIAEATIFVLLVGEKGLGPWQVAEYPAVKTPKRRRRYETSPSKTISSFGRGCSYAAGRIAFR